MQSNIDISSGGKPIYEVLRAEEYMHTEEDDFTFRKCLFELIEAKKASGEIGKDSDAYKNADVSRGTFNKIKSGDTRTPSRDTALALCIGLQLNEPDSHRLLASAGYAFNPYDKRDNAILAAIRCGIYSLLEINEFLDDCNQPALGG